MYNIYKLIDPNTKQMRYIGRTLTTLPVRLIGHIHSAYLRKRQFNDKNDWLVGLMNNYQLPIIELIEATSDRTRERYWISLLKPDLNTVFGDNIEFNQSYSDRRSRTIYQYNLDGEFMQSWKSAAEVERTLGIEPANLSACLVGNRRKAGEFLWSCNYQSSLPAYARQYVTKEVHQYSLNGEYLQSFSSAREAEKEGFSYRHISSCCTGNHKTHKGFKFSFVKSPRYSPILEETQEISLQE